MARDTAEEGELEVDDPKPVHVRLGFGDCCDVCAVAERGWDLGVPEQAPAGSATGKPLDEVGLLSLIKILINQALEECLFSSIKPCKLA